MHRFILGLQPGDKRQGDHINGNSLNNQRCNLRIATNSQNGANARKHSNNTSGYKGVTWNRKLQKWRVQIACCFDSKKEAAKMYDLISQLVFGKFARPNNVA
jgi:hypothetical protein